MNRQEVMDWAKSWPDDDMAVEVRKTSCGRVWLIAKRSHVFAVNQVMDFVLEVGEYPDKVLV